MEALGSAATIAQLVSFSGDILAAGYAYLKKVKNAPSEMKSLLKETAVLDLLLDRLRELTEEASNAQVFAALEMLGRNEVFKDFANLLEVVRMMLKTCEQHHGQHFRNAGKRMMWPFKNKETKDLVEQLRRLMEVLNTALAVDSNNSLQRLEKATKTIDTHVIEALYCALSLHEIDGVRLTNLRSIMAEVKLFSETATEDIHYLKETRRQNVEFEERTALQRWLYSDAIEYEANLQTALKLRHPNTGHWVFELEAFQSWLTCAGSSLWVYGIAGSGKTILSATIIDHILQRSASPHSTKVLWFFCDHRDPTKASFRDTLCSLVKQVCEQEDAAVEDAFSWQQNNFPNWKSPAKPLTNEEYVDLLRNLCRRWPLVSIVIDALDEYTDLQSFVECFQLLLRGSNINILITSRHDVDLRRALDHVVDYRIPLTEHMDRDIETFLTVEVRDRIACKTLKLRDLYLENEITSSLKQKADGMILVAKLQLDYICRLKSDRAIKEGLATLSSELYPTYDSILRQILSTRADDTQDIRLILQWLTYSMVPLTLDQVAEIISVRPQDRTLDRSGIATDAMDLAASLGSLVILVEQDTSGQEIEDLRGESFTIMTLAHSSLEEYLTSSRMGADLAEHFPMDTITVNLSHAMQCLQYVAFENFKSPLTVIDTQGVVLSNDLATRVTSSSIFGSLSLDSDLWHHRPSVSPCRSESEEEPFEEPRAMFADHGSEDNSHSLVLRRSIEVPRRPIEVQNPAHTRQIIDYGAASIRSRAKRNHLQRLQGHQLLVQRTSEFKFYDYACRYWASHLHLSQPSNDSNIKEPLDWFLNASKFYYSSTSELHTLGLYVSWQQMYHHDTTYYCPRRDPLYYAIDFQIDSLIDAFLPRLEEVNSLICGVAPLHVAARSGSLSTVLKLLDLGATVDLPSANDLGKMTSKMTPLHFAAEGGHVEVIRLLLQRGASPHSRNESGSTPFMRAARSGSLKAMKVLYDAGCDINAEKKGHTALAEAVAHGRPRVACQLLHWGADPSIKYTCSDSESALTSLRIARSNMLSKTLERDLKPLTQEEKEQTCSIWATDDDILEEINEARARDGGPERFERLMSGLKRRYLLLKQMEKDTRPGTEREKDYRYGLDPTMIVTITDYRDREDETEYV